MVKTESLGRFGEQCAADYLEKKGYKIIERNFRCRAGEIDVIAADAEYIVFAEVKLRKNADYGEAREFVTLSKQSKVKKAALYYLSGKNLALQPRFDVIEVYAPSGEGGNVTVNHLENAFY